MLFMLFACTSPASDQADPTKFNDLKGLLSNMSEELILNEPSEFQIDSFIRLELDRQLQIDSTRKILKYSVAGKDLYAFTTNKSPRLDHFINFLKNEEAVNIGLKEQFDNYFYQSYFSTDWNLSRFYFEKSVPESELNRFFQMCMLDNYKIIEFE